MELRSVAGVPGAVVQLDLTVSMFSHNYPRQRPAGPRVGPARRARRPPYGHVVRLTAACAFWCMTYRPRTMFRVRTAELRCAAVAAEAPVRSIEARWPVLYELFAAMGTGSEAYNCEVVPLAGWA